MASTSVGAATSTAASPASPTWWRRSSMRYLTRIPPRCRATTRTTRCVRSGTRCSDVLRALLWLAICLHEGCIGAAAGIPVSLRAVVASLTSRPGVHPLTSIAGDLGLVGEPMLVAALDARCDRTMVPDKFVAPSSADVAGRHMLVIDDVWTTGSNAQSAALTLRGAGAAAVSVLVIGRWLDPRKTLAARFIQERCGRRYDVSVCPVTGGRCPPDTGSASTDHDTGRIPGKPRPRRAGPAARHAGRPSDTAADHGARRLAAGRVLVDDLRRRYGGLSAHHLTPSAERGLYRRRGVGAVKYSVADRAGCRIGRRHHSFPLEDPTLMIRWSATRSPHHPSSALPDFTDRRYLLGAGAVLGTPAAGGRMSWSSASREPRLLDELIQASRELVGRMLEKDPKRLRQRSSR